ncbi:MAG: hypothetical protein EP343_22830 [Deltaproteobacteria bacterium]|nr:MAG: hypothetical protein EP343_22830 [Deltaproteobacteria bacterium]
MKFKKIDTLVDPAARQLATRIDNNPNVGNADGLISTEELAKAADLEPDEVLEQHSFEKLGQLQDYVERFGTEVEGPSDTVAPAGGATFTPLSIHFSDNPAPVTEWVDDTITLTDFQELSSAERMFRVPSADRQVADGQSVEIPLEGREIHMIELKYQDTRKLRDLEFNVREPGGAWRTIRGDEYHEMLGKEKRGEVQIKRERDHNSPWINNPVRVKVEIVYPDGKTHLVGKKFLDFHVHDAHSADSSGYPETDNINRTYENIPHGKLPEGSTLRLTPMFMDKKEWEADREIAADLSWVKPIYMPEHTERVSVVNGYGFKDINPEGYDVDPNRPIAGVMVKWTDNGGTSSGSVSFETEHGRHRSSSYNVGSGETELIPLDGKVAKDGKIHINGHGIQVASVEVLYAD